MLRISGLLEQLPVSEKELYSLHLFTLQNTINVIWCFNRVRIAATTQNITTEDFRTLYISHFQISVPIYVVTTGRQIS